MIECLRFIIIAAAANRMCGSSVYALHLHTQSPPRLLPLDSLPTAASCGGGRRAPPTFPVFDCRPWQCRGDSAVVGSKHFQTTSGPPTYQGRSQAGLAGMDNQMSQRVEAKDRLAEDFPIPPERPHPGPLSPTMVPALALAALSLTYPWQPAPIPGTITRTHHFSHQVPSLLTGLR